jgi:malate/lactate dehydrogenase
VPVQLGRKGVEKIIELNLTVDELGQLQASANHVAESVGKLKL